MHVTARGSAINMDSIKPSEGSVCPARTKNASLSWTLDKDSFLCPQLHQRVDVYLYGIVTKQR